MVMDTETKATTAEAQFTADAEAEVTPQQPAAEETAVEEAKAEKGKEPTVAELQADIARITRELTRANSMIGNGLKAKQMETMIARAVANTKAIAEHLQQPDADPKELGRRMEQLSDEEAETIATRDTRDEWMQAVQENIKTAGLASDD